MKPPRDVNRSRGGRRTLHTARSPPGNGTVPSWFGAGTLWFGAKLDPAGDEGAAPPGAPPAWLRGTLRWMAIRVRRARTGDRGARADHRESVRRQGHAGSSGR